ncbi:hypothetical protein PYCCODRAFT_1460282 [Trametes coccinea BRFM310]|uniref:Uncharacterized protein n=1 Tax=Trametes coccinea (strain BRFM310) TaxID=1353009 RepID=A0A1Y2IIL9_TRAC3|nr:hypothetical protein PYCCODRAFT_1460282 [Trametes coccinea BRFM310]
MTLVVPHPLPSGPVVHNSSSVTTSPSPRRSSRISHSHSSPSAPAANHASSPRPRIATPPAAPSRSRSRHTSSYKLRTRSRNPAGSPSASSSPPSDSPSSTSTSTSSSLSPSPFRPPLPSLTIRIRAGSKRKRLPAPAPSTSDTSTSASSSDESDSDSSPTSGSYKLLLATPSSTPSDARYQTPRQLRYAKRQRLNPPTPSSHERSHAPLQASQDAVLLPSHADCSDEDDHVAATSAVAVQLQENAPVSECRREDTVAQEDIVPDVDTRPSEEEQQCEQEDEDEDAPIFTPLPRLRLASRSRQADAGTEPPLWKIACQERVEHLKRVYRDVFRAVVQAEALAFEEIYGESLAPAHAAASATVESEMRKATAGIQFEHYTPDEEQMDDDADADADGDIDMEDVQSSSDSGDSSDSDADADADADTAFYDESDSDSESDDSVEEPPYEQVLILTPASPATDPPPTLPRLSTVRVHGLDSHPTPTRNGIPFIGRGTPAARARRADWALPVSKIPIRSPSRSLSPCEKTWEEQGYFTQDMVPMEPAPVASAAFGVGMQMDYGVDVFGDRDAANQLDAPASSPEHAMPWLDPVLRAESLSPSPPITPGPSTPPASFASGAPSHSPIVPPPYVFQPPTYDAALFDGVAQNVSGGTGCALHATFLECLQAPGCAGPALTSSLYGGASAAPAHPPFVFSPSPSASPSPPLLSPPLTPFVPAAAYDGLVSGATAQGAGAGAYTFPNEELAQFVRAQLDGPPASGSGSVTLRNALG